MKKALVIGPSAPTDQNVVDIHMVDIHNPEWPQALRTAAESASVTSVMTDDTAVALLASTVYVKAEGGEVVPLEVVYRGTRYRRGPGPGALLARL